jgi:hypothetical protein
MTPPNPSASARLDRRDGLCLAALSLFLAVFIARTFDFAAPPYEDPAILMRYSDHLATGEGIVWNRGEAPVDGATDFLFMVALAGIRSLGFSIERSTQIIGLVSHVLTCLVVYVGVRRLHGAPRWMAMLSACYLALGPALRYIEGCYGTPTFGLFACTTWYCAYHAYRNGATRWNSVGFAISALLLGLVRPEGVLLGLLMLGSLLLTRGWRACRRMVLAFVLLFGVPGAVYFFWRWSYFGHPLPNPYYIKGRGHIFPRHAVNGALQLGRLMAPFVPLFLYLFFAGATKVVRAAQGRWRWTPGETFFSFFPALGFVVLGMLHEGLMDYLMRFQYGSVPLLLLSWPALLMGVLREWRFPSPLDPERRRLAAGVVATLFLVALGYQYQAYRFKNPRRWGTLDVARILSEYPHDYCIAVTNAGHLPLYSGWRALDLWGLNDAEIARHGVTAEILRRYRPEVIQFDAGFTPLQKDVPEVPLPWHRAVKVAKTYAEEEGYVLAAAFGRGLSGAHYYYVRPDFPESEEIVRRIRGVSYQFMEGRSYDLTTLEFRTPAEGTERP